MRIDLNDFRTYTKNAPPYIDGALFTQSGILKNDIFAFRIWLRRLCEKNKGLSFLLVSSSHESKGNIEKVKVRTGKAGRPKIVVRGKKAENHIHGLIVNENESNDIEEIKNELRIYCKKRRKKRPNLKRQKITNAWKDNLSIIPYMLRQADSVYRGGTFDFDYFNHYLYMPEDDNYEYIFDFEK